MINNILEISKLESNSLIVHKQEVDLIELLADEKDLKLIKEIDINDRNITTDPQLFKQVVINILSNALKCTNHGSITVSLKEDSLKVTDTGIGIDPKLLPHIFEEFYQSDINMKHLKNSSGLGLALSKKIALLLEEDLKIFSEGKDYSIFSILPPYNNLNAQLIKKDGTNDKHVSSGVTLTYEYERGLDNSINTSSVTKTNFWDYTLSLFSVTLDSDTGLTGNKTPSMTPNPLTYISDYKWWEATGIPIFQNLLLLKRASKLKL